MNQWSIIPLGNTYFNWLLAFFILLLAFRLKPRSMKWWKSSEFKWFTVYAFWIIICILRGLLAAENYWDAKSLVTNSFGLLVLFLMPVFMIAEISKLVLKYWFIVALPLFVVMSLILTTDSYGFYLVPLSLVLLFFPILPKFWKRILLALVIIIVLIDFDARSNIIKLTIPLIISFFAFYPRILNSSFIRRSIPVIFFIPCIFFFLAATNVFNIFDMNNYIEGSYTQSKIVNGEIREINLLQDTRTFLYKEVVISAIVNEYVVFGRTPARGNDSYTFGITTNDELKTGRNERYSNEVSVMNIFTWTGLIGVITYGLLLFSASWMAVTRSNNRFIKIVGLYVAFRWCTGWVEDFNRFDIMNIVLWMAIAMCFSAEFRSYDDKMFKDWVLGIFKRSKKVVGWK